MTTEQTSRPGALSLLPALFAAGLFGALLLALPTVLSGGTLQFGWDWLPALGIRLSFLIDGLSLTFALLISGIGAVVLLYASSYMAGHPHYRRFFLFLTAFMLSMLGLVLAADLIALFVFWELTSVTSYLLIGFSHSDPRARRNALQAMLVTGAGGLALLAGVILIGVAAGTYDLAALLSGPGLQAHPLYSGILLLILLGAFTKSAQFPFHFWLPNAMSAPTPVSAYLHSATMVKAGIYLLARLHPALSGNAAWEITLTAAGLVTAVMASVLAVRQTDLKTALAYTTLMALGTITLFLAGDTPYALSAAITFLIVHSLYKAALFMVVGNIDHGTGTREADHLGGLVRKMPLTALAAGLAALSMAGLPPFLGWMGKELLYAGAQDLSPAALITAGVLLANALMFTVAAVVALAPFHGPLKATPQPAHEADWRMLAGPLLLGSLGLMAGLSSGMVQPLLDQTVQGALAQSRSAGLHLWGGVNLPLVLSALTFLLGGIFYLNRSRLRRGLAGLLSRLPVFDRGWDRCLDGVRGFADWQTGLIQTGKLSHYLTASFAVVGATLLATIALRLPQVSFDLTAPLIMWIIAAAIAGGAIFTLNPQSRLANIAGIGTVGIGVALVFILFGAPDVATTQLMVETLSAVLFGIAMLRLPGIRERRSLRRQAVHGVIALSVGLSVTLTILAIAAHPLDRNLTTFFEENAYLLAHGLNIVNVILVDFRAFDTFGELTVVLLASIGAYALLKRRVPRGEAD